MNETIIAKRVVWRGQKFDSQLEADWAATLTMWGVEYVYHPGRIFLGDTVWEPDFQVEAGDDDLLLEVKGWGNHRIDKVLEARELGYNVVVGRPGIVVGGNEQEFAIAHWEGDFNIAKRGYEEYVFVRDGDEDMGDEVFYSAEVALARNATGIRSFKAVGDTGIR